MLPVTERERPSGSSRTCVGCQKTAAPAELVRFVLGPDGELLPVLGGGAHGRSAWAHPTAACLALAAKRGFAKSFRAPISVDANELVERLRRAAARRALGLLSAALGSRQLAVGASEVKEALTSGKARLVVVAADAGSSAESHEIRAAIAAGRARAWGTRAELGRATHRNETALVAVTDPGLGRALAQAIDWAHTPGARQEAGGDLPTKE